MEDLHSNHRIAEHALPEAGFAVPAGMRREQFGAMGTTVTLLLPERENARGTRMVSELFEEWEQALSRFRGESELSHLNGLSGQRAVVSLLLFQVLMAALAAARATNGIYDPTLLNQMRQIGYDHSFDIMPSIIAKSDYLGKAGGGWRGIQLDRTIRSVMLPDDVQLDFGGIAKGMAVDAALERLRQSGIAPALVNAGGDLGVYGTPPEAGNWLIEIPGREQSWIIPFARGAIATSGLTRRHWRQGETFRHHLLDPRTGLPVDNGLWSVTVAAARCVEAEVAAKVAFIEGSAEGKRFLEEQQLAGLFINGDGTWEAGGHWPVHLMRRRA